MLKIKLASNFLYWQDLLKHTPTDHDDNLPLYLALSKLENVAYQLNEKKRTSEERLAAHLLLNKLSKNTELKHCKSVLYRQDDVMEMVN